MALLIESWLSPQEAIFELRREEDLLERVAAMPMAINEDKAAHDAYFEDARSDLHIALKFAGQVERRAPPGPAARRLLLERIVATERRGRERKGADGL